MGFWNVEAKDLRQGDEVRVRFMGGEEFLTVETVKDLDGAIRLVMWNSVAGPLEDTVPRDQKVTVRR